MPETQQFHDPDSTRAEFYTPRISGDLRSKLEQTLDLMVAQGTSARETLDRNLDLWEAQYNMRVQQRDWPWPSASNVFVPLTATQLDTAVSRLMQLVVAPRLFAVKGLSPQAEQHSYLVERFYNTKLIKNDWVNAIYQFVHMGLRDGTAVMEILWEKKVRVANLVLDAPVVDQETGIPVLDAEGNPVTERIVRPVEIEEYNDVRWTPVELRDFYLFPAWARSIEEAPSVGRVMYLSEADLRAMARAKTLWKDKVEYVIRTVNGQEELPQDEHTETYTMGGQVDVSPSAETKILVKRQQASYFKVWRIHTREFDLDGDGIFEENVLYFHEYTKTLLGAHAYPYAHGRRPFVAFSPMERPNRFYGYSACERLYGIQIELNAIHNQRRDEIDLRLSPPLLRTAGASPDNSARPWGPGTIWNVGQVTDLQMMQLPDVPQSSWEEELLLNNYAKELLGLSDQMVGQAPGGRRTKYEMQLVAAAVTIRMALMACRLQRALHECAYQTHQLTLQYGPDQMSVSIPGAPTREVTIGKDILSLGYDIGINGMGAPLDRQARRQELLFLYNLMMQNPLVRQDMRRVFAMTQRILEEFEIEDTISIIGTEEQAAAMQQQMQQMAQMAAMMGARGGGAPGGAPAGGRRRPKKAAQQQQGVSPFAGIQGGPLGG